MLGNDEAGGTATRPAEDPVSWGLGDDILSQLTEPPLKPLHSKEDTDIPALSKRKRKREPAPEFDQSREVSGLSSML